MVLIYVSYATAKVTTCGMHAMALLRGILIAEVNFLVECI